MMTRRFLFPLGAAIALFVLSGCEDPTGSLTVSTSTAGDTLDLDGYVVTTVHRDTTSPSEGAAVRDTQTVSTGGTATFSALPPGTHEVRLSDVQENCEVNRDTPRRVSVSAQDTTSVSFSVHCEPALFNRIVFTSERGSEPPDTNPEIYAITRDGSETMQLTDNADGWTTDRDWQPLVSPDGQRIAFISHRDNNRELYVTGPASGESTRLTHNAWGGSTRAWDHDPTFSPDGSTIVYCSHRERSDGFGALYDLYAIPSDGGEPRRLTQSADPDQSPSFSPAGDRIAFTSHRDGNENVYTIGSDGGDVTKLTDHEAADDGPVFSPDGERIVFQSDRDGNPELYTMTKAGDDLTRLTNHDGPDRDPTYCPDGGPIVYASVRDGDNEELYAVERDGSERRRLTNHEALDTSPACSPDGETVAFSSTRHEAPELYLVGTDGENLRRLTNNEVSDTDPDWTPAR